MILPLWDTWFMDGIVILKRTENLSNTINVLDNLRWGQKLLTNVWECISKLITLKQFLVKTCSNVLPHPLYRLDIEQCDFYLFTSMIKQYMGNTWTPFLVNSFGENIIAGGLVGGCEKWLPEMLQEFIRTLAKVHRRLRWLFWWWIGFGAFTTFPWTFESYYAYEQRVCF